MVVEEKYQRFIQEVIREQNLEEVFDAMRAVTSGGLYWVGGFLFTGLALKLENKPIQELPDLDFICDEIGELSLPVGWEATQTRFGGPKFRTSRFVIDLWCLRDHRNISRKGLPVTLESYLATVPLTYQAIAYDLEKKHLLGEAWMGSLTSKTIRVHDPESFEVDREIQTLKGRRKAASLGYSFLES